MTIEAAKLTTSLNAKTKGWATTLDASDSTAKEVLGSIREDQHPVFGLRKFIYVRFHQSGGVAAGELQSFLAPVSVANITSGTTTSITTSGLTADLYVGGLLQCIDDAGAAGAAPEGEKALITKNTTTVITIDADDAFSAAPAANDDFEIVLPFAVVDSDDTDYSYEVAGVTMAAHDQYNYGWVQFYGLHPSVATVAAGTAIVKGEIVVAGAALVTDGAGDGLELSVGVAKTGLSSDTVLRETLVDLYCGPANKASVTTA